MKFLSYTAALTLCLTLIYTCTFAQGTRKVKSDSTTKTETKSKTDTASMTATILTADSLTTGSYKDIFSNFFQLAVKDLTGPAKSVTFTSNPYAIMLRHNDSLAMYKNYRKYTWLRRTNFTVGAKLDSSYRFNGMTASLNIALFDKRDYTIQKKFLADLYHDTLINIYLTVDQAAGVVLLRKNLPNIDSLIDQMNTYFNKPQKDTLTFSQLDKNVQAAITAVLDTMALNPTYGSIVKDIIKSRNFNLYQQAYDNYIAARTLFQNRGLYTIGVSDTSYNDAIFSKNVQLTMEYAKGLYKTTHHNYNFQMDLKAALNFADDTLNPGRNLHREVFTFTPTISYVLNSAKDQQPWLEFDLGGSYSNVWKGHLYKGEDQIVNTINGTLRVLITDNIWIPVTIKYDWKTGNVFGLLDVTTNFTGLGNLFKGNSKKS